MTDSTVYPMPASMTMTSFSSMAASAGVTLTASVTPTTAADKTVDWSVVWNNPASAWASGKSASSYLTVTPSSDGSLTATVNCLAAFGEQVKITVTSRINETATATCAVDYAKRLTDTAELAFNSNLFAPTQEMSSANTSTVTCLKAGPWQGYMPIFTQATFEYVPEYGTGTVVDSGFSYKVSVAPTSALNTALNAQGLSSTTAWKEIGICNVWNLFENLCSNVFPRNGVAGAYDRLNKFLTAVINCNAEYDFEMKLSAKTSFETKEYIFKCRFDRNSAGLAVQSISLNDTALVV
jgi:hypothetical protein